MSYQIDTNNIEEIKSESTHEVIDMDTGERICTLNILNGESLKTYRAHIRPVKASVIKRMESYMFNEGFSHDHLEAVSSVIFLMNECEESEKEILAFAKHLRRRYAPETK